MTLYIVQHGKAFTKDENPKRPLTQVGIDEVSKVAESVAAKGITVEKIIHSGKERAQETAELIQEKLGKALPIEVMSKLGPNDDLAPLLSRIEKEDNLMIVGHLPYLNRLISQLIVGDSEATVVKVRNGAVNALSKSETGWAINWIEMP